MCGIAGFLHTSFPQEKWKNTLLCMAGKLVHRGPDDEGVWFDVKDGVGLAHRRLSIIDLSAEGHQPMVSQSGRYVIVYNGEVYNFNNIRKSLEKQNIQWRGHSDTEVILAAIETWGFESALKHFIGMFAFALWDRKERILYLCRDRLGIKPLYYALIRKGVVFGSELKALMPHPNYDPAINRDAITLYLRHNCIPAPYCIYQNTWKLQPAQFLRIPMETLENGKDFPKPYTYWSANMIAESGQTKPNNFSLEEATSQLEDLLRDAIGLRMVSDVPLGAFLSGGVDSSTVVALMQAQSSRPVKTFSIGFSDDMYNEAKHAEVVAKYLGTEHTELFVSSDEAMGVIPNLPNLYDEPFSDSSQIPTFLLSKLTRQYVTVSLSGDGGDELFAGYNRHFWGQDIWQKIGRMPKSLKNIASKTLKSVSPRIWDSIFKKAGLILPERLNLRMPGDKVHKFSEIIGAENFKDMYLRLVSHWENPEKIVFYSTEPLSVVTNKCYYPNFLDNTQLIMYLDLVTYLPDDILTKIDRASMGVSLEARVPLLDHRVVEFALRLPIFMKVRNSQGKWILRQILYKYIPKELIERPKMGFGIPIVSWLRGPLRDWAETLLDERRLVQEGFFNPKPIRQKWEEHLSGRMNWQYHLWDILMFQAWLENQ